MQVHSAILFETPAEIYARVFHQLRPRTEVPRIQVEFCRFANANSTIRVADGAMRVRITDVLEGAPAPIQEALAYILIGKVFRKAIPATYSDRYRRWLNRADVRKHVQTLRAVRGRKYIASATGEHYDLEQVFEDLNRRFFHGLMARPQLSWSRQVSRRTLGHWDPAHNAIIISRIFDAATVPKVALEYVMFHEMLHLRFPVEHHGPRRCVHTSEFKAAEKEFPGLKEAKAALNLL